MASHCCEFCGRRFDIFARADKRVCDERCRSAMRRGKEPAERRLREAIRQLGPGLGRPGRPTHAVAEVSLSINAEEIARNAAREPRVIGLPPDGDELRPESVRMTGRLWSNQPVRPEVAALPENDPTGPWAI
jgi:hypothetical protein